MESKKQYLAQEKHIRSNYVRFPLDLKPEMLEAFRSKCHENGTTPTTEIKKIITQYINDEQKMRHS